MNGDLSDVVDVNLVSVEQQGDVISVEREMVRADGSIVVGHHKFPVDTLEWRAAEYGIDPTDLDTLLDIVIHEPFLGDPDRPDLALHEAPTVEEARAYHLERIQKIKDKSKKVKAADPVREQVKGLAVMNPEAIQIKAKMVGKIRSMVKEEKEARAKAGLRALVVPTPDPEEARLAQLHAMLNNDRPTANGRPQ